MSESQKNIVAMMPGKPDAEIAADFKKRLVEAHEPILKILDEIHAAGFGAQFQCGLGGLGKHIIQRLVIVKEF